LLPPPPPSPPSLEVPPTKPVLHLPENVFCTYCGAKNPSDASFCQKCGKKITRST
jgi:predicted amidophosphoribosyltransferase